ncbi:MAG: hypothetical protein KY449_09550, partial [Proteobacteria bacterium]|nr:hypothetical protein [Pseudomonadota bacterium]
MSFRRSPTALTADLRALLAGAAAAGLLSACGMPQPTEPPPPPMAEMDAPPELYGAPMDETGPAGQAYAGAEGENPYADQRPAFPVGPEGQPGMMAEARRPGWGTMDPIPNPPGSAPSPRERAMAEAQPSPYADARPGEPGLPRTEERLGAYATAPTAPVTPYAEAGPPPPPYEAAPYAEGTPASAYPPVVVQMQPVPNPPEGRGASRGAVQHTVSPREEARAAEPRRETPRRTARAAADQRLMGGPAPAQRRAQQAEAASADRPARNAAATGASATRPAQPESRPGAAASRTATPRTQTTPAARRGAATLPAANTPEGRAARLKQLQATLAQLVQRDSTLTVPERIRPGQTERITLTLPQALSETLTREARAVGLRELASAAEVRVDLACEGWRIEPEE